MENVDLLFIIGIEVADTEQIYFPFFFLRLRFILAIAILQLRLLGES